MLFDSPDKWWGDHGRRDHPHEGLDFCLYRDHRGHIHRLDERTRIPVTLAGMVVAMFKDYLGQAVVVEHSIPDSDTGSLLTFYAHTRLQTDLRVGATVRAGEVIATIADTSRSKAKILPHLHFSLGWTSAPIDYKRFEWNTIRSAEITLLNPLEVLDGSYEVPAQGSPECRDL
jgi:murein DD-endopeptidase MepM/ murein hydrolase activator NlpD